MNLVPTNGSLGQEAAQQGKAGPGCPGIDSRAITEVPVRDDVQILGSPLLAYSSWAGEMKATQRPCVTETSCSLSNVPRATPVKTKQTNKPQL